AALLDCFRAFASERDWRLAVLGASEGWLEHYRRAGLHAAYHGDEAGIDVSGFTLAGRPIREGRPSLPPPPPPGLTARVLRPDAVDAGLRAELEAVARAWRGDEPERGFTMALDALFGIDDAVFVIGAGPDGRARGFLHFAVCRPGRALSLSSMPRL